MAFKQSTLVAIVKMRAKFFTGKTFEGKVIPWAVFTFHSPRVNTKRYTRTFSCIDPI